MAKIVLWNEKIRNEVWSKLLVTIFATSVISSVAFVGSYIFPSGDDKVEESRPIVKTHTSDPKPSAIVPANPPTEDITPPTPNVAADEHDYVSIEMKKARMIIDRNDNRDVKLLDMNIIYFHPTPLQKLAGWFFLIFPIVMVPIGLISGSIEGCLFFLFLPILTIVFGLIFGFILSAFWNTLLANFTDWIPIQYAAYKIETFLNWLYAIF